MQSLKFPRHISHLIGRVIYIARRFASAMQKVMLLVVSLFLMASVSAIDWETVDCPTLAYTQQTFEMTQIVNNASIISLMNGETVDLTIFRNGSPFQIAGKVEDGKIREIQCGKRADATLDVTIQQQALERIYLANDQVSEFIQLKKEGAIRTEGKSLATQTKVAIAEFTLILYNFFGVKLF